MRSKVAAARIAASGSSAIRAVRRLDLVEEGGEVHRQGNGAGLYVVDVGVPVAFRAAGVVQVRIPPLDGFPVERVAGGAAPAARTRAAQLGGDRGTERAVVHVPVSAPVHRRPASGVEVHRARLDAAGQQDARSALVLVTELFGLPHAGLLPIGTPVSLERPARTAHPKRRSAHWPGRPVDNPARPWRAPAGEYPNR
ncbi:hypothetical protein ACFC5Z_39740 [Streptomyces sp. NPDC056004]|uniref:hypothetical protein n=1 Tax=Streptomyces sp. NPDC056004 TaxID=3345677 RepID=UPI0035D7E871